MRRLLAFCLLLFLCCVFSLFFNQRALALPIPPPGGPAIGNVGKNCVCNIPDTAGSGKNGFTCTVYDIVGANLGTGVAYCNGSNLACYNDVNAPAYTNPYIDRAGGTSKFDMSSAQGIICRVPTPAPPVPISTPPPGQICLNPNARCDQGPTTACCTTKGNYVCKLDASNDANKGHNTCQLDTSCLAQGKTGCTVNNSEVNCCKYNPSGQPLYCKPGFMPKVDGGLGTCTAQPTACITQGKDCSGGGGGSCCNGLYCQPPKPHGTVRLCEPQTPVTSSAYKCKCQGTGGLYQCAQQGGFTTVGACASNALCEENQDDPLGVYTTPAPPVTGIFCKAINPLIPPAPPCAKFDTDGRCLTVSTSFGDVSTDPAGFITRIFGILLGASGAIALILIMRAGYRLMTSRGNPEGIQAGREQLIAAIVGLMFLIFSLVLLQVIGVDILRVPGFGS